MDVICQADQSRSAPAEHAIEVVALPGQVPRQPSHVRASACVPLPHVALQGPAAPQTDQATAAPAEHACDIDSAALRQVLSPRHPTQRRVLLCVPTPHAVEQAPHTPQFVNEKAAPRAHFWCREPVPYTIFVKRPRH